MSNESDENSCEQLRPKAATLDSNPPGERLIIFPHESHQLVNIDLFAASNAVSSEGEMARAFEYEPEIIQQKATDLNEIPFNCMVYIYRSILRNIVLDL